jgi:hypothetical protein
LLENDAFVAFLRDLETTGMSRSYKMLVLSAMLDAGRLPGGIGLGDLATRVAEMASRQASIRDDLSVDPTNLPMLEGKLRQMPIAKLAGGARAKGGPWFRFRDADGVFETVGEFGVAAADREVAAGLVREIVEWRLAQYFLRDSPNTGERSPD